ncbi:MULTISPECIES: GNAT family N-acetyltransferase [Stenotrophomonas]|jgi:hypothetical protein|uniref:GNAT family N-acetyltransferase n=1 Tax=Stenotrophomonas maltophilia TaxID=40324 RepID=A0A6S4RNN0_STEMA|nr:MULTISPECIES: GNAT family N-acetyltransferase [Stenotrophomonas]EKT4092653.1 GNAT family N-acetyltransferase [Stenotrophomonas maltophilia]ELC7363522.1 GNAT family N-acetyltransferase [Stenotrophomonas maltophilia]EMB2829634.1 GNAT family N-acetyltransferase [Stenotrophomonas maltophilia]MBA2130405.1 N-acetyltransferase [Stenotrophomonas maltophilia]MBH1556732.1 GNAT family N-acetyltransferase [Stenotrophomonas maltophilia]
MFGKFKKQASKPMTGAELAEEGLRQVAIAAKNGDIDFQRGRVHEDIFAHADQPAGMMRLTYVMISPTVENEVIARCVMLLDRVEANTPVFQMDWAVLESYRGQGFGIAVALKSLMEFTNGMQGKLKSGYVIEAVVDEGNDASLKIARKILGGEKVLPNPAIGKNTHSFLRVFPA